MTMAKVLNSVVVKRGKSGVPNHNTVLQIQQDDTKNAQ